ncbi:MAG: hypothetical protein HYW24_01425 [Candidatus Aenigmarchaeota archaeon]|nr:hypothetical protein [Candidatus Aenigmarchaeota archaeon]
MPNLTVIVRDEKTRKPIGNARVISKTDNKPLNAIWDTTKPPGEQEKEPQFGYYKDILSRGEHVISVKANGYKDYESDIIPLLSTDRTIPVNLTPTGVSGFFEPTKKAFGIGPGKLGNWKRGTWSWIFAGVSTVLYVLAFLSIWTPLASTIGSPSTIGIFLLGLFTVALSSYFGANRVAGAVSENLPNVIMGLIITLLMFFIAILPLINTIPIIKDSLFLKTVAFLTIFTLAMLSSKARGIAPTIGHSLVWSIVALIVLIGINFFVSGTAFNIDFYINSLDVLRIIGLDQNTIDGMKEGIRKIISYLFAIGQIKPEPDAVKIGGYEAIQLKFGSRHTDFVPPNAFARLDYTLPITIINPNNVEDFVNPVTGFYVDEIFMFNRSNEKMLCGVVEGAGKSEPITSIKSQEEKSMIIQFKNKTDCRDIIAKSRNIQDVATVNPLFPIKFKQDVNSENITEMTKTGKDFVCERECGETLNNSNNLYGIKNELDKNETAYIESENKCACKFQKLYNLMDDLCFTDNKANIEMRANYNFSVEGKGELILVNKDSDKKFTSDPKITSSAGPLTVTTYFSPDIYSAESDSSRGITMFIRIDNSGEGDAKITGFDIKDLDIENGCSPKPVNLIVKKGDIKETGIPITCDASVFKNRDIKEPFTTIPVVVDINYTYSQTYSTAIGLQKASIRGEIIEGSDEYNRLVEQYSPLPYYCPRDMKVYSGWPVTVKVIPPGSGTTPTGSCTPVNSGPCSTGDLRSTCFGINAIKASSICNIESSGNPTVASTVDKCKDGTSFSHGLFQINIIAHANEIGGDCMNLFTINGPGILGTCLESDSDGNCIKHDCEAKDSNQYTRCVDRINDVTRNIQIACQISNNGIDWNAWGANKKCNF